ncbi:hypothetical protein RHGRI_004094 [Rhododendron griersonianum]|uniref:Cytochrome P450 n=1 Tax=Rhododendron griersonianum TaxID=479676 RepID=A0AAV6L7L5_9ERIC|nr:hypothetical protein RHGRI_004094 [Rhododendron griersonianum]
MEEALSLALAFLIVSLTISFFVVRNGSDVGSRLPPGGSGLPFVGETLDFFLNPEKFIRDRMKKHSPDIFRTTFFGEKIVVICGPNGHKFLWSNENKYFTSFYPEAMKKLFLSNQPKRVIREEDLKAIRSGPGVLKPESLIHNLAGMDSIIQQQLKIHLEGKSEVKIHPFSRAVTLTLACRFFMGTENPERIAKLIGHFDKITEGIQSLPVNFPGTAFYNACRAADVVRKELATVIKEKIDAAAAVGSPSQDMLSALISGGYMSDAEIADKVMGTLVAGYTTVATTMTFFMKSVGERPEVYHKLLTEQLEISKAKQPGEALSWEDMQKMKYSWAVVLWTVNTTQKNPEYFPEPNKFDPSRFLEGKAPPAYTFVPFGGGPRMCPGNEYARIVILAFVHNVVKKYKWAILDPREKILGSMMPVPEKGLPVRLYPR